MSEKLWSDDRIANQVLQGATMKTKEHQFGMPVQSVLNLCKQVRDEYEAELAKHDNMMHELGGEILDRDKRRWSRLVKMETELARLRSLLPELIDTAKLLRGLLVLAGEKADIFELTSPSHEITLNVPEIMERVDAIIAKAEQEGGANE